MPYKKWGHYSPEPNRTDLNDYMFCDFKNDLNIGSMEDNVIVMYIHRQDFLSLLVRTKCVRTHIVRARADVVATKLGIIHLFLFLLPSMYLSPRRGLPRKLKLGG